MTETGSSFFFFPWVITSEEDSWGVNDAHPRWKNARSIRLAHNFQNLSLEITPHTSGQEYFHRGKFGLSRFENATSIRKSFFIINFLIGGDQPCVSLLSLSS